MSSPITTWEGAEAYFTFAHSPAAIAIILALSVIVVFFVLYNMAMHENESYRKLD
ncbi:hypothetical protein [Zavarzinia aquatilis]|uniref:hypothetical protein n=1 Tax=Zavarzinia aquatilis TaxID=2211142 RepID=UPI00140230DC|nr:hypothetical protein [Zavarzinia aquatilis]